MDLAPIILFCYNRPEHTKKTIEALKKNNLAKNSDLHIFLDGPKRDEDKEKINEIEKYINEIEGFNKCYLYKSNNNKGLANSVIDGVTQIINECEKAIVLEDDIVTSKKFLLFMNEALNFYKNDTNIYSISGYSIPIDIPESYKESVYLSYRSMSGSWSTWKDRWNKIDWEIKDYDEFVNNLRNVDNFKRGGDDMPQMLKMQIEGKIDSWAIRWCYNQYKNRQFAVLPIKSLVSNIGWDGSGTHSDKTNRYDNELDEEYTWSFKNDLQVDSDIANRFRKFYSLQLPEEKLKMQREVNLFLLKWIDSLIENKYISMKIKEKYNVNSISIYGCGTIGIRLYRQLKKENILKINCFIDKNTNQNFNDIKCLNVNEYLKEYTMKELIIVSPFYYYDEILKNIMVISNKVKVASIEEVIK
ncbi:glycosyltransferase [Clostridium sp. JS66]|uniref:glycosyltransferase n=1 Tax=Clostridium sp. JS66 TaxID=3064705 RepID=UPI00298E97BE|nr:glycosyltransferase [Clostridium sp. JS66]WPC41027.1 glycosyltransferase [Clostridium sp. JS66]